MSHGVAKFQGGISNIAGWFQSIGIPGSMAYVVATIELVGGIALILGLGTRIVSAILAIILLIATFKVKLAVGFLGNGQMAGYELDLALIGMAVYLLFNGSHKLAIDSLFKKVNLLRYKRSILKRRGPMIQIYAAENRYQVNLGWLQSRLSFSFGEYYDPNNTDFGVMRVCNDDVVEPGRGFGAHPHSDMEIVTIVLEGAVQHSDNLGNSEITSAGEVQRMSAGTGIVHAEFNASKTEPTRFLQLWFEPRELGLFPTYETRRYDSEQLRNALLPVVTPEGSEQAAMINQDVTLYLSRLDQGKTLSLSKKKVVEYSCS